MNRYLCIKKYKCKIRSIFMVLFLKMKNRKRFNCGLLDVYCDKNAEITTKGISRINIDKLYIGPNGSVAAVDGDITIKDAALSQNVTVVSRQGRIVIESGVAMGPNCCVYDHDHEYDYNGIKEGYTSGYVIIEKNVWLGAGVIVLKNTRIGEGTIIGAGCVIKGDIPAHSVVTTNRELLRIREIRK